MKDDRMRMVPSEFRKFRSVSCLFAMLTLLVLFGCSRSAPTPKSNQFFVTWLQGHGESNVVVDAQGVGVADNPTRLRSSLYGSKKFTNSFTAELEFRVRIPDGREIIEYVAGSDDFHWHSIRSRDLSFIPTWGWQTSTGMAGSTSYCVPGAQCPSYSI